MPAHAYYVFVDRVAFFFFSFLTFCITDSVTNGMNEHRSRLYINTCV